MSKTNRRRLMLFGLPIVIAVPAVAWAGGGFGHRTCHRGAADLTEETVTARMGFATDHVLDLVDATDTQYDEVDALIERAVPDVMSFRTRARSLRTEAHALLALDDLDTGELERIRTDAVNLFDEGSEKVVKLMVDFHDVLDADQRTTLIDEYQARHGE